MTAALLKLHDRPNKSFQRPLRISQTKPDAQKWCCSMRILKVTCLSSLGCTHSCPNMLADSDAFMALPKRKGHCLLHRI